MQHQWSFSRTPPYLTDVYKQVRHRHQSVGRMNAQCKAK